MLETAVDWVIKALLGLATIIVTLLSWIGLQLFGRVSKVETDHSVAASMGAAMAERLTQLDRDNKDTRETMLRLDGDMRVRVEANMVETRSEIRRVHDKVDEMSDTLSGVAASQKIMLSTLLRKESES